jgi:hypothetical protein
VVDERGIRAISNFDNGFRRKAFGGRQLSLPLLYKSDVFEAAGATTSIVVDVETIGGCPPHRTVILVKHVISPPPKFQ